MLIRMIHTLAKQIATLPPHERALCDRIFDVHVASGYADLPPPMRPWIAQQFGALSAVQAQTIIRVANRWTLDETLFNPVRARRPSAAAPAHDAALDEWTAAELRQRDMFGQPEQHTTADLFGRVRGRFCTTAANVAKYAAWHGLVIFDEPHPLRWSRAQLRDYLDTAWRWLLAAHAHDAAAVYPIITWNCLPKSGATLMHGHMQLALAHQRAYAHVERWRRAAELYRAAWQRNYFDDLHAVHAVLGLQVLPGSTRAFASLTPQRSREIVLLAHSDALQPAGLHTLADALDSVLRGLIDKQGVRAFNVAVALPPLAATSDVWADVPSFARVVDRGDALSRHSDIGAMELFASGCVVTDPFDVAARLRAARYTGS